MNKMGCPSEMRPDMAVTDIAYCILKNRGQALHFKELISEVITVKAISQQASGRLMAQMHTEISLDSRFVHQGGGAWGLREWVNKGSKVIKIRPETTATPPRKRPDLRGDEEDDIEAFEEEEAEEYEKEESEEEEDRNNDDEDNFEEEEDED